MTDKPSPGSPEAVEAGCTALRDENEKLKKRVEWFTHAIHTCHDECDRPLCKTTRERDALRAELERKDAVLREWLRADVALKWALKPGNNAKIDAIVNRVRAAKKAARAALSPAQKEGEA